MDRFWELFEKSTLVSGIIALGVLGGVVYLSVTGRPIPDSLSSAAMLILGYFFGSKTTDNAYRTIMRRE